MLSYKKILVFWYPLAATWLMMAVENPFLAAVIARIPNPKYNLAAFGVAFSFALIIEAPIIMLMTASTALVKDRDSYFKLRRFSFVLNGAITLAMLVLLIPTLFYGLTVSLMEINAEVARLTHTTLLLLLPWPAAIGFRRFYQGLLIRHNLTRRVAYGTLVRLTSMTTAALLFFYFKLKGAYVGAAALSIGVTCEAVASRFMAHRTIAHILSTAPAATPGSKPLSFSFISRFYYPLALMTILSLGVHPLVTFFMGKGPAPLESLAVLPVVNALVFVFRSMGLSFQEVGVALLGEDNRGYVPLRNFAAILAAVVTSILALIAFTPLANTWFGTISGLTSELTRFAYLPTQLMVFLPAMSVWISFQRAYLVNIKNTAPISKSTILEVLLIASVLFVSIYHFQIVGAAAAAAAYTLGRISANLYLFSFQRLRDSRSLKVADR